MAPAPAKVQLNVHAGEGRGLLRAYPAGDETLHDGALRALFADGYATRFADTDASRLTDTDALVTANSYAIVHGFC